MVWLLFPIHQEYLLVAKSILLQYNQCIHIQSGSSGCRTGNRETKQQPSMLPGPAVPGCCFVSFCLLCDIHSIHSVVCTIGCRRRFGSLFLSFPDKTAAARTLPLELRRGAADIRHIPFLCRRCQRFEFSVTFYFQAWSSFWEIPNLLAN